MNRKEDGGYPFLRELPAITSLRPHPLRRHSSRRLLRWVRHESIPPACSMNTSLELLPLICFFFCGQHDV